MKLLVLLLFLLTTIFSYGQSDFNSLWKSSQSLTVPYTSKYNKEIHSGKKELTRNDRIYLISKLTATKPAIVNKIVRSPFGQMDCNDIEECLDSENIKEMAIIGFVKTHCDHYLIHVSLKSESHIDILVSVTNNGEFTDWFFAGNSTWGNPNGRLSREFKIDTKYSITVSETSWGKNNVNYYLEAEYSVFCDVENKDQNIENEYKNSDSSRNSKIEYFELKEGKFELTKLCIEY